MASIDPTAKLPSDAPMPVKAWNFSKRKKTRKIVKKGNMRKQSNTWRAYHDTNPPGIQPNNPADEEAQSDPAPTPASFQSSYTEQVLCWKQ